MYECVTVYAALHSCPRPLRMQSIVAILGLQAGFAMATPAALCLHPSMGLGSMGIRARMRVWDPCETESKRTKFCGCHLQSHRDRQLHSKIQITFSQLSPLKQLYLCGWRSSLLGLFGSCSGGHWSLHYCSSTKSFLSPLMTGITCLPPLFPSLSSQNQRHPAMSSLWNKKDCRSRSYNHLNHV